LGFHQLSPTARWTAGYVPAQWGNQTQSVVQSRLGKGIGVSRYGNGPAAVDSSINIEFCDTLADQYRQCLRGDADPRRIGSRVAAALLTRTNSLRLRRASKIGINTSCAINFDGSLLAVEVHHAFELPRYGVLGCLDLRSSSLGRNGLLADVPT